MNYIAVKKVAISFMKGQTNVHDKSKVDHLCNVYTVELEIVVIRNCWTRKSSNQTIFFL